MFLVNEYLNFGTHLFFVMLCCLHGKAKSKKKKEIGFLECLGSGTQGRGFL
jgi:hypothetical protein